MTDSKNNPPRTDSPSDSSQAKPRYKCERCGAEHETISPERRREIAAWATAELERRTEHRTIEQQAHENTDRELWRRDGGEACDPDNYYQPSIHVTKEGAIGINVGGYVYVKPVEEWHKLAGGPFPAVPEPLSSNPLPSWMPKPADMTSSEMWLWTEVERLTSALHEATRREAALTAELAECIRKRGEAGERNIALTAERDRLAADNARLCGMIDADRGKHLETQEAHDRLRAALVHLLSWLPPVDMTVSYRNDGRNDAIQRAHKALAGAADETEAVRPGDQPYCRKCGGPHWVGQCGLI